VPYSIHSDFAISQPRYSSRNPLDQR